MKNALFLLVISLCSTSHAHDWSCGIFKSKPAHSGECALSHIKKICTHVHAHHLYAISDEAERRRLVLLPQEQFTRELALLTKAAFPHPMAYNQCTRCLYMTYHQCAPAICCCSMFCGPYLTEFAILGLYRMYQMQQPLGSDQDLARDFEHEYPEHIAPVCSAMLGVFGITLRCLIAELKRYENRHRHFVRFKDVIEVSELRAHAPTAQSIMQTNATPPEINPV